MIARKECRTVISLRFLLLLAVTSLSLPLSPYAASLPNPTKPANPMEATEKPSLDPLNRQQPQLKQPTPVAQPLRIAVAPPAGVPLLANLPACMAAPSGNYYLIPAGGACLPRPTKEQAQRPADGRIPAANWTVETSGGIHPVQLSISTPQNPQLAGLFTLLTPTLGNLPAPANSAAKALEDGMARGGPAGPVRRIISFAGMPFDGATPREIIVVIQARDQAGSVRQTDFRIYPYSPRITTARLVGEPRFQVAHANLMMHVDIAGIGQAQRMVPHELPARAENQCWWMERGDGTASPTRSLPTNTSPVEIGPNPGAVTLLRSGVIYSGGNGGFSCTFAQYARFDFPRSARPENSSWDDVVLMAAPQTVTLAPRAIYRYSDTWQLRERFGWFPANEHGYETKIGNCVGYSDGLSGKFVVGPHNHNGDLSFRIRSGPLGTHCRYFDIRTESIKLKNGFLLESSSWSTSGGSTKCHVIRRNDPQVSGGPIISFEFSRGGSTPWIIPPEPLSSVTGFDDPLVDPTTGGTLATGGNGREFRSVLKPIVAELKCDNTGTNDHEVRLTLEEVVFSGPAGTSGP